MSDEVTCGLPACIAAGEHDPDADHPPKPRERGCEMCNQGAVTCGACGTPWYMPARSSLSRQGEGDVVERVLAVECPEFAQCNGSKGRACFPAAGGYPDVFCASRLRASTPTPAPLLEGPRLRDDRYLLCRVAAIVEDLVGDKHGRILDMLESSMPPSLPPGPLREFQPARDALWRLGREFRDLADEKAYVTMINEALDAIQAHLGSAPWQHAGLDPATVEACAKEAMKVAKTYWSEAEAAEESGMYDEAEETEAAAMASERIAADIRALGSAPRRPGGGGGESESCSIPSSPPAEEKKP